METMYVIEAKKLMFRGFNFKHGYAVFKFRGKEGYFFTSGHCCNGYIYLYHCNKGEYQPRWVDTDVLVEIFGYQFQEYLKRTQQL